MYEISVNLENFIKKSHVVLGGVRTTSRFELSLLPDVLLDEIEAWMADIIEQNEDASLNRWGVKVDIKTDDAVYRGCWPLWHDWNNRKATIVFDYKEKK